MNLVEQLRCKRAQAHDHLSSRKRKLVELFAVTACAEHFYNAPPSPQYLQRLQAFQDANDLQNGRRFNESTLPQRPALRCQPRQPTPEPTTSDASKTSSNRSAPVSVLVKGAPPAEENGMEKSTVSSDPSSRPKIQDDENKSVRISDVSETRDGKTSSESVVSGKVLPADESPSQQRPQPANFSQTRPIPRLLPNNINKIETETESRMAGTTRDDGDVVLTHSGDIQSSPASTNDPSSNTSAPTFGSPTTTDGGEEFSSKDITDTRKDSIHRHTETEPTRTASDTDKLPAHKASLTSVDLDMMDTDPTIAFDSTTPLPPPTIQVQRETTSRPRPEIRVDTQHSLGPAFRPQAITSGAFVETPAQMTGVGSAQPTSGIASVSALDSTKRATRISSGALLKKSVSEILGETPKSTSSHVESSFSPSRDANQSSTVLAKQAERERKERERSKLSTVVFAKPQRPAIDGDVVPPPGSSDLVAGQANHEERDYLYTLFESKAYSSKQGNLTHLLQHSHKTITTADHLIDYEYQAQCRVLKRLYQLQSAERWSLRQRKRADEPVRQTSHWDFLIDQARWMRTDFREERKWKLAAARSLAEYCAEWVASSPEQRKLLQVHVKPTRSRSRPDDTSDVVMEEVVVESSHPTPELMLPGEDESVSEDIADPRDITLSAAPAAIFSLGASDFTFVADRTPAFDKLINELPLYEPASIEPDLSKSNLAAKMDARWMTDIVHVSRYATEKLKVRDIKPPFKRSRYDYDDESSPPTKVEPISPRDNSVGLFMPENKHIRDRIHPGHSFRPPSEYNMPTQAFFETRTSSQWTPAEDDELRRLVKDYSYNWSLISSCLTPRSLYTSSPDRRTPWECFERWIGLEGMPADMAKTPYFRTYSGRIDAASRQLQIQLEEAQPRAGPNVPIPNRKRTTQPMRVEKKRAQRHLAMLDAMRKLAKKRETVRQKQSQSAELAAMRKATEANHHNKPPVKTPAEFSAIKHEREQKMAKQQEIYRQQLIAHQRAASAQQQRVPTGQAGGAPNGMPQAAGAGRGASNGVPGPLPGSHLQVPNGISRPHHAMLGPNGIPVPAGMANSKAIQAQIQANIRAGIGSSPQQIRMQQEQLIRQAQQNGNHSSPSTAHSNTANGLVPDTNGLNGQMSPSAGIAGAASPPRQPGNIGQALSSGHVPVLTQIAANIKQRHPNMSDEDVQRAASQQLTTWQQQATAAAAGQTPRPRVNQAALNAAMGAANAAAHASNVAAAATNGVYTPGQSMMTSEQMQQYNQRMRLQQAQQQLTRGLAAVQVPMGDQMTNSPIMNMARPVSQHAHQAALNNRGAAPGQKTGGTLPAGIVHSNVPGTPGGTLPQTGQAPAQGSPARPPSQQHAI